MKRAWNSPRVIFTALQVCSVLAAVEGVAMLSMTLSGGFPAMAAQIVEGALWCVMWLSFLRMCGRLKREPSAFTERNGQTLLVIAVCCGVTGAMLTVEAVAAASMLPRGLLFGGALGSLATVAVFFGMMTVSLVLRRLLKSAIALQQENDLTI